MRAIETMPLAARVRAAKDALADGAARSGGAVGLACSFSVEDVVIIDIMHEMELPASVFAIDTGRLPEETCELADEVAARYGIMLEWYFPDRDDVERLVREKGQFSFRDSLANRHECCHVRKVEPLMRALSGLSGWITGLRREQSVTRGEVASVEVDDLNGGIIKMNPLADWTDADVAAYARENALPVNRLFAKGYKQVGCTPCTRAVAPGEHPRAGRWWWEDPMHKECGLHAR